jgi:hypothetical protein
VTFAVESATIPCTRRIAAASSGSSNSCARTCPVALRVNTVGLRDASCTAYSAMMSAS